MLLLGLTGSIATGKSTVSNLLRSAPYNLPIIDADVIARQVVEPGTAGYKAIVAHFGPTTPDLLLPPTSDNDNGDNSGRGRPLNRPALGRKVFGSSEQTQRDRAVLNGIVHPAVRRAIYGAIVAAYLQGHWAVVLDIPLLFESGWERYCGSIMVVAVSDPSQQIARLRARDAHLSDEDARNRVLSQGDVREKAARVLRRGGDAGLVVWNDGDRELLEIRVAEAMARLRRASPRWWSWLLLLCPPLAGLVAAWSFWRMRRVQLLWEAEKAREKARL
ncbi:uncharacterized protein K452DRAFT_314528 [Aplosporella prunicola CBS 121167]|uniref:Dephospho-CoA kinase n=1 Tax=Aplosporella prunicola CBS 121167 TaxID=1176127 RepID=A0A6A6BWX0_9PEZI|nr:uncharacterized protein K452DRAFT_314528 [Aplosporella prunicola CBS 121167]KAF2147344.1 hypothetical protein K452DRAFT_314528 [Aplosporella prunicola CBS 121167]